MNSGVDAFELPVWAYAQGGPAASGVIRRRAEDFQVEEIAAIQPQGEGGHCWLWLEKTGQNTAWVARQLAQRAGVRERDVGYAGRKDRHGICRQYFSIPRPHDSGGIDAIQDWRIPGVKILQATPHSRKLKRGALRGNRFQIRVRQLTGDFRRLEAGLQTINDLGVPNYFGPQRFGRDGRNLLKARAMFTQGRRFHRQQRGMLLSAARSYLFNQVLSERVIQGNWNQLIPGDLAQLKGSRARFSVERIDAELIRRCRSFDISPTGPLPGSGEAPGRAAGELEARALLPHGIWLQGLLERGLSADRRTLRLQLETLRWNFCGDALTLAFELPAGAYATAVLRELVDYVDEQLPSHRQENNG